MRKSIALIAFAAVTIPALQACSMFGGDKPARHYASSDTSSLRPPMGMRVRLKASFDLSGYPRDAQVILQALKTYGMIVADNGSNWYVSGAPDERWNNDALTSELRQVHGSDFEVVRMDGLVAG